MAGLLSIHRPDFERFCLPNQRRLPEYSYVDEKPKGEFQVHENFAAADEANYAYYRSLSGNEKLKLMLEIMGPIWEAQPHFERVYRVVERSWGRST
jgi:hypothetical protein